jgi:prevent-host-death family protein
MMHTVPIVEAKAGFSALIARVEAGEEVAITRHGKVVARLGDCRKIIYQNG